MCVCGNGEVRDGQGTGGVRYRHGEKMVRFRVMAQCQGDARLGDDGVKSVRLFVRRNGLFGVDALQREEGGGEGGAEEGGEGGGHAADGEHPALLRLHAHVVQDAEGHGGSADVVVVPVDHVADVVHIGGDLAQLDLVLVVAQLRQQVPRHLGTAGHMGETVLGVAQGDERGVRLGDIGPDLL